MNVVRAQRGYGEHVLGTRVRQLAESTSAAASARATAGAVARSSANTVWVCERGDVTLAESVEFGDPHGVAHNVSIVS